MKKNIFIGILIVVIGCLVFIQFQKKDNKTEPILDENNSTFKISESFSPGSASYINLLNAIKKFDSTAGVPRPISVEQRVDITGDGIPELLVSTGNGGAAMDAFTVVRYENQNLEVVNIRDNTGKTGDGRPGYYSAMSGSGGSGRYGSSIELLSNKNSILTKVYSIYGEPEDYCYAIVYTWNNQTKFFEYNTLLSKQYTNDLIPVCKKVASDTGVIFIDKN